MPLVRVDDIRLYFEVHGTAGSPLLMVPGYNSPQVEWPRPQLELLAESHRVVVFDSRGTGKSDRPSDGYSMQQFAADVIGLLDGLEIERAHVAGLSMGGMIAQHVALEHPQRVHGLVLGATAAGEPGRPILFPPSAEVLSALARPSTGDPAEDSRLAWPILYTPGYVAKERAALERLIELALAYPTTPAFVKELQFSAILQSHDTASRLGEIAAPTLIQAGGKDVLIPVENARVLAERIPGARLIVYPEAAHGYFHETGLVAAQDMLNFLQGVDAAVPSAG
jgi:pimeloyl-ACP methyl ester carboxylesterase